MDTEAEKKRLNQKAVKPLYLTCNKVDKSCVLAVNSVHYTRASCKITALCNKC